MALLRGSSNLRTGFEPTDADIMNVVSQQAAPATQTSSPLAQQLLANWQGLGTEVGIGSAGTPNAEIGGRPLAQVAEDFAQRLSQQGITDISQISAESGSQISWTPEGHGNVSLVYAGGKLIPVWASSSDATTIRNVALAAVATTLTAGALTPVMGALGMSEATAALVAKAVAPTVVQAAMTGDFNLENAARNVAVNMLAPSIGNAVSAQVQNAYFDVTDNVLPNSVARAVSNAAASAAATAIQQGADTGDIGTNALAGAIASGVGSTLNSVGVDPSIAAGVGRAVGSYVSTGDAAQSIVSGITRGMSFEDQRQIAETQRQTTEAYRDPSRAFDVPPTTTDEAAITNLMQQEAALPAAEEVAAPAPAPAPAVTDQQIVEALQQEAQAPAPAPEPAPTPSPTERVEVTGAAQQPVLDEAFATVSGAAPAPSPAPAEAPAAAPAPVPAPAPSIQTVEVPGTKVSDQEILDLIQSDLPTADVEPPVVPTPAPPPSETQDQRYAVTGTAQAPAPSAEDVVSDVAAPSPAPADQRIDITASPAAQQYTVSGSPVTDEDVLSVIQTPPDQRIDITGTKDQRYTVSGSPVTEEDVISTVPDQRIDITGTKDQRYEVTGSPITEEDVIYDVPTDVEQEAAPPAPAQEPFQAEDVYPTDIFSYVNRGKPTRAPSPLLTQALSPGGPGRVGLSYARPAGEIESEITGKKRRNVWNEASLRLKDALGL